jgi:predicted ATPase
MSTVPQGIFVIVGNDGTGKTTIVNQINQSSNFKAVERNTKETFGIDPKITDRLTFFPQWNPNYGRVLQKVFALKY